MSGSYRVLEMLGVPTTPDGGEPDVSGDESRGFGFASAHDVPINYLRRTRDYYAALGYGKPYEWAHFADVPFHRLRKPLSQSRVTLVTTAAPFRAENGDQGPGAAYNAQAKFYQVYSGDPALDHDLRISHVAIDRQHTTAIDSGCWFPLPALRQAAVEGLIGEVAARFHGAPTNRSHRATLQIDGPQIVARCQADQVDAVLLVPNCPVCHQSVSLIARLLEAAGIATVVMGCAKDIVEYVGVPRLLFSDFPLGNAAGRPNDLASQAFTLRLAMQLLDAAPAPRTTVQSPLQWATDPDWKLDYCNIDCLSIEEIARRRAEFDTGKATAMQLRTESERR